MIAAGGKAQWLVGLVSFGWFFRGSWQPALSVDESATLVVVRQSASTVWRYAQLDPALGPYYLLLKPWSAVSESYVWLRLPSVIAMSLVVCLTFTLTRKALDEVAATFVAVAMLSLPLIARYAAEARPYALALLALMIGINAWWTFRVGGQRRYVLVLFAALVGGALMHAYTLTIILPIVATSALLPGTDRRKELLGITAAFFGAVLLLAPYFWFLAGHAAGAPDRFDVTAFNVARMFLRLPIYYATPVSLVLGALLFGLCAVGVWSSWRGPLPSRRFGFLAGSWLVLIPSSLILLQLLTGGPGLVVRYWIFAVPALALLAGMGLWWLGGRSTASALALCGLLLTLAFFADLRTTQTDGHAGQGYVTFAESMRTRPFDTMPILTHSAAYRSIVANDPGLAHRIPLMTASAQPLNEIHPATSSPDSPQFRALADQTPFVAYQPIKKRNNNAPTDHDFLPSFEAPLKQLSQPLVLCSYFGDRVGVFASPSLVVSDAEKLRMAKVLVDPAPSRIQCHVSAR